jgi:outer membrane protein
MRRIPFAFIFLTALALPALAKEKPRPEKTAEKPRVLTLKEARAIALKEHPRITIAEMQLLASKQAVRQAQAAYFPTIEGSLGASASGNPANTRIVSSTFALSSVYDHAWASVIATQLITDFGRTWHLTKSSKLKAGAEERNSEAARAQLLLQVDSAYLDSLQAKALLAVAESTVKTRKLLRDLTATLAKNKLKSELDASFAEVDYQQALLLESKAQNDLKSSFATLAAVLGRPETDTFHLVDTPAPGTLPPSVSPLMSLAVENRPDLQRLRLEHIGAEEFAKAEAALNHPSLSMQGIAGVLPYRDSGLNQNYTAAGFVMSVPFFSGGLNTARRKEAEFRAKAAGAVLLDEENNAMRDVRLAWLAAKNAQERIGIAVKLVEQSGKSLELAQARYDVGSSSIVELSQAQLGLTSAEITLTNARYEYLIRRSLLDYQTGTLH